MRIRDKHIYFFFWYPLSNTVEGICLAYPMPESKRLEVDGRAS